MESLVLTILIFILIIVIFLPLDKLFPRKSLRKLIMALNEHVLEEKQKDRGLQERLFAFCEKICRLLNIKIKPDNYDKYKEKLVMAGLNEKMSVEKLLGVKIMTATVVFLFYFLLFVSFDFSLNLFVLALVMSFIGYYAPDSVINGKVKRRQWQLQVELPNVLNTLAIITDAGLGFTEAIKKVCEIRKGVLITELKKVLDEVNMGVLQRDALLRMSERCRVNEISIFIFTLVQSLEKGASGVTIVLKEQSKEVWEKRKNKARDLGEKASMKLFMPMLLLAFPCLFVFLIGPAVISILRLLGD